MAGFGGTYKPNYMLRNQYGIPAMEWKPNPPAPLTAEQRAAANQTFSEMEPGWRALISHCFALSLRQRLLYCTVFVTVPLSVLFGVTIGVQNDTFIGGLVSTIVLGIFLFALSVCWCACCCKSHRSEENQSLLQDRVQQI